LTNLLLANAYIVQRVLMDLSFRREKWLR
jgi:hypothetical protein